MKSILSFILVCFLILNSSCDFPDEANADCNGINLGSAYIDECGRCVGGDTPFTAGQDKDLCGTCFGNNDCARCNDINAINYVDIEQSFIDNDLCIYDLCEEYMPSVSTVFECSSSESTAIYNEGDQLRCIDVELPFDVCYPGNCDSAFTLSSLYGKVSWIEITSSWWGTCYTALPEADELIVDFLHNEDVFIMSVLLDEYQPHSCSGWAQAGNEGLPFLLSGGTSVDFGGSNFFENSFFSAGGIPKRIFIDHELKVYSIDSGYMTINEIKQKLNEMLQLKGE